MPLSPLAQPHGQVPIEVHTTLPPPHHNNAHSHPHPPVPIELDNPLPPPPPKGIRASPTSPTNPLPNQILPPHHVAVRPPPQPPPRSTQQDYIPENIGRVLYDSFKILGLGLGPSEREVKQAYCELARQYHPDKWKETHHATGMTLEESTAHFQQLNNAQSHLRQVL